MLTAIMLRPGKELDIIDLNVFCTAYLCNGVLRAKIERPESHGIQKQRMSAIPENKSGPVKDRERRNESDKEHVQTFVQKHRCNRCCLNRGGHTRRLQNIISYILHAEIRNWCLTELVTMSETSRTA